MDRKKVLELDKICRVCIVERKEMRPLFSEKIAEMLMECTEVNVEATEGWPDKICVQCVHSVSRCHAFKMLVERNDKELREYIRKLTVHVVEPPATLATPTTTTLSPATSSTTLSAAKELKLQQSQAKLLQLQQQQAQLQKQQEQQQQERLLLEKQQQKQQKLLQKQLKQQQLMQQQQQQQHHQIQHQQQQQQLPTQKGRKSNLISTTNQTTKQRLSKKPQLLPQPTTQQQQQQQHQQQQQQQQHHHQQQQLIQTQQAQQTQVTHPVPIAITAAPPNNLLANTTLNAVRTATQPQQQPQQQLQTTQLLPTTTTTMPQQLVLPNGQVITAQILTHTGPPQIAQIISTAPSTNITTSSAVSTLNTQQQQYATPQLLHTTNGQTLQIIQQPNGQQTYQFLQLVPQRPLSTLTTAGNGSNQTGGTSIIKLEDTNALFEHADEEHQLMDDEDEFDTGVGGMEEDDEEVCETIVVEEDQIQAQLLPSSTTSRLNEDSLSQNQEEELEYIEDVVTTTTASTGVNTLHYQHHHHQQDYLQDGDVDDDYIIEELPDEDDLEYLAEESGDDVMHVMDSSTAEYISEEDDVSHQQHLMEDSDGHELQYAVMETNDDTDTLVEADVHEVFQAACGGDGSDLNSSSPNTTIILNQVVSGVGETTLVPTEVTPSRKRKATSSASKAAANNRQLAATATSIAAAARDDDLEIDAKLIAEFISQQTSSLTGGRYACNLCHQEFKQFKGLQTHMHQHSNWIRANCKKQPECEICFKSFKGPGMLRMHMKTHQSASRTPLCTFCGKTFKTKAILYRHRASHRQLSYACAVENCRKTFSSALTLKQHVERKHAETHANASATKFKCGECGVLFTELESLEQHVQLSGHGANAMVGRSPGNSANGGSLVTLNATTAGVNVGDVLLVTQA